MSQDNLNHPLVNKMQDSAFGAYILLAFRKKLAKKPVVVVAGSLHSSRDPRATDISNVDNGAMFSCIVVFIPLLLLG